ncbi:MAG TPA: hypothetical protein VNV65_07460 [Candidatus Solibacter sp.]|jgi:hypothetical protein|nr:hypothetical protein [Candidatus Solibacter sp.]
MGESSPSQAPLRVRSVRQEAETIAAVSDPIGRTGLRVAYHARRYSVIYTLGVLGVASLLMMPTVAETAKAPTGTAQTSGGAYGGAAPSGAPGDNGAGTPTPVAGSNGAGTATGVAPPVGKVAVGTGVTRGGFPCSPGAHQLPYSQYAAPCVATFTGYNGGATWNGVTATTIKLVYHQCQDSTGPNAAAVDKESQAAGGETYEAEETHVRQLIDYINRTFEFYGRHIEVQDWTGACNFTNESVGTDQVNANSDANYVANSLHAFTDLNWQGLYENEPFAQAAAHYHMYLGFAQLYFPESEYIAEDPYIWAPTPSCTIGGAQEAEFVGKQLAPFPAKWAGDVTLNGQPRKFGVWIPANAGYQECQTRVQNIDAQQYGMATSRWDMYKYPLDISQWPSEAQKAAIQFSSDHDTTVVLSSDPLSPIFLTQDAYSLNYHPEWMLTGVALTDQDNLAQLWDQQELKGHLFGMSQLGSSKVAQDPNGEAAVTLRAANVPVNPGTILNYYELMPIFDQLQAAGPILTPANIAAGTKRLPRFGGATAADGTWFYGNTHTAIIDSREIYWDETQTSQANGMQGTYVEIYNGRRFELGQYPTGQPPFYP